MAHSQAARVHEIENENEGDTVASRLAGHASRYVKIVAGYPVAVKAPYDLSTNEGKILSWAYMNRAASTANAAITQGKESKLDDAGKRKYLSEYLNGGYSFTSDLGSEFSASLLDHAMKRVALGVCKASGKLTYANSPKDVAAGTDTEMLNAIVKRIDAMPDKYTPIVNSMVETILNEKHAIRTRKSGTNVPVNVDDVEL